jgi:tetratricopeptide (TPR) repeat protein
MTRWLAQRLSRFGAAFIWPIEQVFRLCARKLFAVAERAERFEPALLVPLRVLAWPFRAFGFVIGWCLARLVPGPVRGALAIPVRRFWSMRRRLGAKFIWLSDVLNLDRAVLWLAWLLRPLWYPIAAIGNFVIAWAATRHPKKLVGGLPAVLLVLPILIGVAWSVLWGQRTVASRYRLAVNDALEEKDYDRVQLFERKLSQLGVDTKLSEFNTAQALERDGQIAEAYERMQRLAPLDAPGYPPAHFWIIHHLLSGDLAVSADDAQRLASSHLDRLASLGVKGAQLDMTRAYLLAGVNQLDEAAAILKPHVHIDPLAAIERFRLNLALGQREEARQDAVAVRRHMQRLNRSGEAMTSYDYQWWAAAEELLGDPPRTRHVLREWLRVDPLNENARSGLAALSVDEFDQLVSSFDLPPGEFARRIREAFESAPVPEQIKLRLAALYHQRQTRAGLVAVFDELTASSDLPPALAEVLGTAAGVSGEWDRAQACLEQAVAGDPSNAVAWNNLACVLLQQPDAGLESSLAASERALQLQPLDYRFRETRGQIFARLGRWQEAVDDLEYALNGMPDVPAIHRSLGKAYDALGETQLAAVHRQHAE